MRISKLALATALCVAALGVGTASSFVASASTSRTTLTVAQCVKLAKGEVHTKGKFTIATDNPVYPPWFVANSPSNGKGYESAVAYDVALTLGFKHALVAWYTQPYATSTLPGAKPFDFDIDEITYNASLASNVSFSSSYFNLNQSLVALKTSKVVAHHTAKQLKSYLYGDQAGSAGLAFIKNVIKPTRAPIVYKTLAAAAVALQAKHIDAIVVDTPDGQYMASEELTGAVQVAQFKSTGNYYALVLQKSNPLLACVDTALKSLSQSGKLSALSKKYLAIYNEIPFITP
jgi:polar amino acid transport system substrate-binding protein